MSKAVIILISLSIILALSLLLLAGFAKKQPAVEDVQKIDRQTSPNPSVAVSLPQLTVVSSNPANSSVNQSLNTSISIRFSRQPTEAELQVKVDPSFEYILAIPDESLFISPTAPLLPNTTYTVSVSYADLKTYAWKFSTGTSSVIDTTPGAQFFQERDANLREQRPDLYLYNNTPFENSDFKITTGPLKSTPTSHYSFIVVLKNQSSTALTNWLKSLGFTDTQIQQLDIEYQ